LNKSKIKKLYYYTKTNKEKEGLVRSSENLDDGMIKNNSDLQVELLENTGTFLKEQQKDINRSVI
jgi:hypothetical protein